MSSFYSLLLIGIVLIALELITTSFYLLIIGISCIIASILALITHDWYLSSLCAGVLSIVGCFVLRQHKSKQSSGKMMVDHIGQEVEVISIEAGKLQVLYSGTYWQATTSKIETAKVGDRLKITKFTNHELTIE